MRNAIRTTAGPGVIGRLIGTLAWIPMVWASWVQPALAQNVTLAWDRDASHTNLAAFIVKYGGSSGSYTGQVSVATNVTSATVSNLSSGRTYFFVVTARNVAGVESDPSNEVTTNTPSGPNQPPTAIAASVSTSEDQARTIVLAGTDPEGDALSYSIVANPANGSLSGTPPNLTYTPAANFVGNDSFTFRVSDGLSNSSPATVSISVTAVNDPPTLAGPSNVSVAEDAGLQTVSLAGIGSGAPNESQTLTVTASSSNTGLVPNPAVNYSSPNATGSLTFTPAANANGTATITVTVNDGQPVNNTVTRTFTVTVTAVNDVPTLTAPNNITINEDSGLQTVSLTGIGSGAANESQSLTVTAASSNTGLIPNPTVNYTSPSTTGTLTFTSVTNASGTATITITVNDGQSANNTVVRTFTVTVNAVNDAPTLAVLSNVTINEDADPQTVSLAGIGSGAVNESQTLTITASSSNAGLVPNPAVNYTSPNATGSLTFTPAANASATATITVTVNDGQSQNSTVARTFTVTVNAVNDPPTLNSLGNLVINEDAGPQTVSLSGISSGAANETQTLSISATSSNPALIPNPTVSYASPNSTGILTLQSAANATGNSTITVTVNDGQSQNNTLTRTFTVTVNGVNDAPTISDIANQTINENTSTAAISFVVGDLETSAAGLTLTGTSSSQTLVPNSNIVFGGSGANRTVTVTPASTLFGSAVITIQVSDGNGGTATDTFTLTVNGVNQPPTLNPLSNLAVNEDSGLQTVSLSGISSGAANEIQTLAVTATSSNPALIPAPAVSYTSPNSTGTISFTPTANAGGSSTISVTVNDGQGQSSTITRTFVVTVNAVNDAPTISDVADQSISQNSSTAVIPFVIGDLETTATSLTVVAGSSNPTLVPTANIVLGGTTINRTVKVTPAQNQFGSAIVTLTVSDGTGGIASDSFVVNVAAGNLPPTIDGLNDLTIVEDAGPQTVALTGITSGSPNESQALTVSVVSGNPTLIPNPTLNYASPASTGSISFTPVADAYGSAIITVVVNDGQSQNNTAATAFTVTVNPVNDSPTLNSVANVNLTDGAGPQTVPLSGITSGAANENQSLTIAAVSSNPALIPNPTINYFSPNTTGTLGFTPAAGSPGTATITVTVSDGQSQNSTAVRTFTVTVSGSNQPPTITDVADLSIPVGSSAVPIALVIGDAETPAINLQLSARSSNPSLVSSNNVIFGNAGSNRVAYLTPTTGQSGVAIVTFTVTDSDGGTASDSFVLTVVAPNARPTLDFLPDLVLNEDSGLRTVNLTGVTDGSTSEDQTLILSAVSDNPAVVPHPIVNYTNPDTAGTLTFTPMTNASGSAYITVTVNDGQAQNNLLVRSFRVWVNAVNDAPGITPIPNQQVENSTSTDTLPFVISDVELPTTSLSVTANSSNPTLIPNANVVLGGSGANRTIKVTPVALLSGSSTISIFVSDGSLTAASAFLVTVGATNTPPVVEAPSALTTDSYTVLDNVPVLVTDNESRPEDLVLTITSYNQTVLPATNITISGTGSNRTVTLKPVSGKSGDVGLSFALTDGRALTRASCQLTVQLGTPPKAKLSVRKKGRGNVQPELDGADLTIGASYTLTAVPASDELFTGWSGSVTSSTPSVTFVMASNTILEVAFTNNPYLSKKGSYNGLFYEVAEVKQKSSGSFTISASDRGTYTGKLKLGSATYRLSGRIDLQCKATNTIVRKGYSTVCVELDFAGGATNQVVGRVTDRIWEAPLLGDLACYNSKTEPAPFLGTYTLIIPGQNAPEDGPEGDGFGTVKVDGNGLATFAGTLADGTKVSQKVPLSRDGQWPLYVPLYRGTGSILSWLTVTNQVTGDINGLLSWIKPVQAKAKYYGGGFTNEAFVTGSQFVRPTSATNRVLNLSEAGVTFSGGNLESDWTNVVLWSLQNKITNLGDNKLTMKISPTSGLFSGTVVDPSTGKSAKFSGAVHQKQNFGAGFSLGTDLSARVVVQE